MPQTWELNFAPIKAKFYVFFYVNTPLKISFTH